VRIARFTTGEDPRFGVVEDGPDGEVLAVIVGDPLYTPVQPTGERVPIDDARLLAPVIPRSKVIGVGKNYADHAAEMGGEVPSEPLIFLRPNTSVIGPGDPIQLPAGSTEVHYEGELAVVIGRLCRDVPPGRVGEVILGYTCANDVTARDWQRGDGQWWRAKGFDGSCPLGPYLVTGLALDDVADLTLTTRRDGEVVQSARTSQMVFDITRIVVHVSSAMTLLPGDVILTGTPAGVGPITAGQRVEVEVEGLGVLSNPVVKR
jgi:2-keto-4-pentenoate hydratase/2-oxohepta-3-ene-1,7-dioic acid hydratase in catechol pathway